MLPFAAPFAGEEAMGQWERVSPGTHGFVVPAGVYFISAVAIGGHGAARSVGPFEGGAGPGLHWRNDIPVTPGETLTVTVPSGGQFGFNPVGGAATLTRGATVLLQATGGALTTTVGQSSAGTLGGGGGSGGPGGFGGGGGDGGGGGGCAGYLGSGGAAENFTSQLPPGGTLPPGGASSGAGRGGATPGGANEASSGWASLGGEPVGLQGLDGQYGSPIGSQVGGGGFDGDGQGGGLRVMWGGGRSYPSNARDI